MRHLNRREFVGAAVAGMALQQRGALPQRPNVVFILADDMGYGDLSSYGRPDYKTPVLDSMTDEGIKFMDNYAGAPVCTPTRVSFHTDDTLIVFLLDCKSLSATRIKSWVSLRNTPHWRPCLRPTIMKPP